MREGKLRYRRQYSVGKLVVIQFWGCDFVFYSSAKCRSWTLGWSRTAASQQVTASMQQSGVGS